MMAARPIWAASAASPSIRIMPGRKGVSAKLGIGQQGPAPAEDPGAAHGNDPDEGHGQGQEQQEALRAHLARGDPHHDRHDQHGEDVIDHRRADDHPSGRGGKRAEPLEGTRR